MSDDELISRLTEAAIASIENERQAIAYDRRRLRGITVELEIRNNGGVIEGETYVNRTANVSRILGPMPALPAEAGGLT